MIIGDIMFTSPFCVSPDSSLSGVISMMSDNQHSCVLINDIHGLVGIFTERDVVKLFAALKTNDRFQDMAISEAMTRDVRFVRANTKLSAALSISKNQGFRHLPVVDRGGQVIGLVTQPHIVDSYLNLFEKQAELEDAIEELKSLSLEDPLLKIGNRRAMESDLQFTEAFSKRNKQFYTVVLIDVDYFKNYNDHYGHQAGDQILQVIANNIKQVKRSSDRVYRYGGEEILVLMPNTPLVGARLGAERLRISLERLQLTHAGSPLGFITASIGLAESLGGPWEQAVEDADTALYEAKHDGRNNVKCHSSLTPLEIPRQQSGFRSDLHP